jgi:hypothetical protein
VLVIVALAVILILPNIALASESIVGTQDDSFGVWLFNAGKDFPAEEPTDDIIERAIFYDLLEYIGDSAGEVYSFGWGPVEPVPGQEDTTLAEVLEGLAAIDDFGYLANGDDDQANFDTGSGGFFFGGFARDDPFVIVADGIIADGTLGPSGATSQVEAEQAIEGYEIFIFEDAELSGMIVTLSNDLGWEFTFTLNDLQVDPPTQNAADDTLIAIDLDNITGFCGSYVNAIRIEDDGIPQSRTDTGDTTLEIDAIVVKKSVKNPVITSWVITYDIFDNPTDVFDLGDTVRIKAYSEMTPYNIYVMDPSNVTIWSDVSLTPNYSKDVATITTTLGWWHIKIGCESVPFAVAWYHVIPELPLGVLGALAACFAGLSIKKIRHRK